MADGTIAIDEPSVIDKYLDTESLTVGATTVQRERVRIAGANASDLAPVSSTLGLSVDNKSLPPGAATETTLGTRLSESDFDAKVGSLTETAPTTDTASSGLNGRLQRIAQRLTSLIALLPTALTGSGNFKVALSESTVTQVVSGDVAASSADSGNPLKIGAKAVSSEPAATSAGSRQNLLSDLVGKLITLPYANPENFVSGAITTSMTGTTSTSLIAAPGVGLRNYITTIIVSNAHATVGTDVVIQDGSGGTTLLTIPAAAVYGGAVITLPTPLRQPTTNTALFAQNVTTGASTKVSAVGYKGA